MRRAPDEDALDPAMLAQPYKALVFDTEAEYHEVIAGLSAVLKRDPKNWVARHNLRIAQAELADFHVTYADAE